MIKTLKRISAIALIGALTFALTACGGGGEEAASTSAGAAPKAGEKLVVCLDYMPNTNHTGMYVALDKGYYEEAGLDVSIQPPPEGGAPALVAAGKAQFGVDYQDLLAAGWANDTPLSVTAVSALVQHNTSGLMSLKESGIESPKDLEGKTYGTWDNPVELAIVRDVIKVDGGDPEKLNILSTSATDVVAALKTDLDVIWVYYAWDGIAAELKGLEFNYMPFKDMEPTFDYYTPVLIANDEYLKNNPEEAKKFLEATKRGYEYAIEHPEEAADILLNHADGLDKEIAYASQKWLSKEYIADAPYWGYIDPERWNAFYKWLADNDLTEKPIPENFGFSNDYLPAE